MSSSLRNATKRRTHKERGQPENRRQLGFLEKKKDYKERAENYQKRSARLKVLEKKALGRNEDEYYAGMTQERSREESKKKHSEIAKLKDEDLRVVQMKKVVAERKVEKMRATLQETGAAPTLNEHTFFFGEAADDAIVDAKATRRLSQSAVGPSPSKIAPAQKKQLRRAYSRLTAALDEKDATARAFQLLTSEKVAMTAKGKKRKVKDAADGMPAVYKWKKQRKQ